MECVARLRTLVVSYNEGVADRVEESADGVTQGADYVAEKVGNLRLRLGSSFTLELLLRASSSSALDPAPIIAGKADVSAGRAKASATVTFMMTLVRMSIGGEVEE